MTTPHAHARPFILGITIIGALALSFASAQLVKPATGPTPTPTPPIPDSAIAALYLPPGKYTAIVLTSNAKERRLIVSIKTSRGSFPVTIAPQSTLIVPFEGGWTVQASDNARVESAYTPFEDIGLRNPISDNENLGISAWGITDRGPVNFAPPK